MMPDPAHPDREASPAERAARPSPPGVSPAWLRYGMVLAPLAIVLATFSLPPLERTQEARVLETAREMLGGGWRAWMVPHLNGHVRLQKPPLAYWLTAASFKALGVSVWAGRLPMAAAAVLTLLITYRIGRWLFEGVAASAAWATTCGSLLFCRLGLHAETDVLATLFVTCAVYAFWRAWGADAVGRRAFWWHHLAGGSCAMALMVKGGPAVFPFVFLFGLALAQRGWWRVAWRFCATGGVVTFAALACPWFAYVALVPEAKVLASELSTVVAGRGHEHGPWFYLVHAWPETAPWAGFVAVSLVAAAGPAGRTDDRVRGLAAWLLAILVPLTLLGQKQEHYLLFALPPLGLMVGWAVGRALTGSDEALLRGFGWVVAGMLVVAVAAVPVPLLAGLAARGRSVALDLVLSALVAALATLGWREHVRRGTRASLPILLAGGAGFMAVVVCIWVPTLSGTTYADLAAELHRRFPDRPLAFYETENLPLVFHMRRVIPEVAAAGLDAAMVREPDLLIVAVRPNEEAKRRLASLHRVLSVVIDKHNVAVYCRRGTENPSCRYGTRPRRRSGGPSAERFQRRQ